MKLRIAYRYDHESKHWSFVAPSLGIVGGADTRREAEQRAIGAIVFTLESDGNGETDPSVDVEYLTVSLTEYRFADMAPYMSLGHSPAETRPRAGIPGSITPNWYKSLPGG